MIQQPTPAAVTGLWKYMTAYYKTTVINKADSTMMTLVGTLLDGLHIVNKEDFLKNYTTTLGRSIYAAFTVGDASAAQYGWPLWEQLVVCVHEHTHIVQMDKLGMATYSYRYLTDTSARARFEAEAYRTAQELEWWHARALPDVTYLANHLQGYGVSQADITTARLILESSAEMVKRGGIVNEAAHVALGWLNEHAKELRAA